MKIRVTQFPTQLTACIKVGFRGFCGDAARTGLAMHQFGQGEVKKDGGLAQYGGVLRVTDPRSGSVVKRRAATPGIFGARVPWAQAHGYHGDVVTRQGGSAAGFTMVEIAICLAIIGLALVAIIGVLPIGMNVQRDNREETVINQDATVLLESIRSGERAGTDLTNYVYAITNFQSIYGATMQLQRTEVQGYSYQGSLINGIASPFALTNNARIIGLLSTPEYLLNFQVPANNLLGGGVSNHVVAYVHSMSGPAVEKPPQDNSILVGDSFTYRVLAVNAPLATDTNLLALPLAQQEYSRQLAANLHELRLSFTWPVRPNGTIGADGPKPQTQRTLLAGSIVNTNDNKQILFFYQSQTFTNQP